MSLESKDREEVRTMLHDMLAGWQATTVAQNDITNLTLREIKDHLKTLNGKVAEHEKAINVHLPHTIQHCPQSLIIKSLEQDMVTWRRLKNVVVTSIGGFAGLLTIVWLVYKLFIEKASPA
jgi:hypothetical protein